MQHPVQAEVLATKRFVAEAPVPRPRTARRASGPVPAAGYRPELDGLRFFAFLAVFCNHTLYFGISEHHHHLPNWLGNILGTIGIAGNFGVDLFLVLSSYLITDLLLQERATAGSIDVRAFYCRRLLRIWPLYVSFLLLAYGLTWVIPGETLTWPRLLGYLLFVGNWVYLFHPLKTVAGPLWSVSLEEQFYLFGPWVLRRASRARIAAFSLCLVGAGLLSSEAMNLLRPDQDWVTMNSFSRMDGIAVGLLLAVVLRHRVPNLSGGLRVALLGTSIAVLLWIAHDFGVTKRPVTGLHLAIGWPLAAVACGGVLVACLGGSGPMTAILRTRPLVYLGKISYGLYVFHELVLTLLEPVFPRHASSPWQMAGYWCFGVGITVPLAAASYRWLESPFLRLKKRRYTLIESRPP